jgi:50S ribosome-binding GTPase
MRRHMDGDAQPQTDQLSVCLSQQASSHLRRHKDGGTQPFLGVKQDLVNLRCLRALCPAQPLACTRIDRLWCAHGHALHQVWSVVYRFSRGHVLHQVKLHRRQYRDRRFEANVPVVALVGYTNAGKSTLLNSLADSNVHAEDLLFATLDPTTRCVAMPSGKEVCLAVGGHAFCHARPHRGWCAHALQKRGLSV